MLWARNVAWKLASPFQREPIEQMQRVWIGYPSPKVIKCIPEIYTGYTKVTKERSVAGNENKVNQKANTDPHVSRRTESRRLAGKSHQKRQNERCELGCRRDSKTTGL